MDRIEDIGVSEFDNGSRLIACRDMCAEMGLDAGVFYSNVHSGGRGGKQIMYYNIARHIHTIKEVAINDEKKMYYAICFYQDLIKDPVARIFVDQENVQHMAFELQQTRNYYLGSFIDNLIFIYENLNEAISKNKSVYVCEQEMNPEYLRNSLIDVIYRYKPEVLL